MMMEKEKEKLCDTILEELNKVIDTSVEHRNLRPKNAVWDLRERIGWRIENFFEYGTDFLKKYRKAKADGLMKKFRREHPKAFFRGQDELDYLEKNKN